MFFVTVVCSFVDWWNHLYLLAWFLLLFFC